MAAKHRAPDSPDDVVTSRGEPRRGPKPGEKPRRRPSYRRVPVEIVKPEPRRTVTYHAAPETPRSSSPTTPVGNRRSRLRDVAGEGHEYARRAAIRGDTGRPSVAGRAVASGAAGAATGAAVGGPVGAAVGGGIGTVAGGVSGARAKREYRRAASRAPGARRLLVAEFTVCIVVVALSPITDKHRDDAPGDQLKRFTAVAGLFFVLALVAAAGPGAARLASGFGGLVAVALAVSERAVFARLAEIVSTRGGPQQAGTGEDIGRVGASVDPGDVAAEGRIGRRLP